MVQRHERRAWLAAVALIAASALVLAAVPAARWWILREPRRMPAPPAITAMRACAAEEIADEAFRRAFRSAFANEVADGGPEMAMGTLLALRRRGIVPAIDVDGNPSDRFGIESMPGLATHIIGLEIRPGPRSRSASPSATGGPGT